MAASGWGVLNVLFASLSLFSGVAQFSAISLMQAGAPLASLAMAALVINSRHVPMGFSIASRYRDATLAQRLLLGFTLCEESFAVNSMYPADPVPDGFRTKRYFLLTGLLVYLCWGGSSVLGATVGAHISLPADLLTFVVPLVFGCLLVENLRSTRLYGPLATTLIVAAGVLLSVPRAYQMVLMILIPAAFHGIVLVVRSEGLPAGRSEDAA